MYSNIENGILVKKKYFCLKRKYRVVPFYIRSMMQFETVEKSPPFQASLFAVGMIEIYFKMD